MASIGVAARAAAAAGGAAGSRSPLAASGGGSGSSSAASGTLLFLSPLATQVADELTRRLAPDFKPTTDTPVDARITDFDGTRTRVLGVGVVGVWGFANSFVPKPRTPTPSPNAGVHYRLQIPSEARTHVRFSMVIPAWKDLKVCVRRAPPSRSVGSTLAKPLSYLSPLPPQLPTPTGAAWRSTWQRRTAAC